jgi:outer membrane protein TolC
MMVFAVVPPALGQGLTFEEAWGRVEQSHEGIRAERQALERVRNTREAAKALKRPSIKLNASYTHLSDPIQLNILDLEPLASLGDSQLGQILAELLEGIGISPGDVNRAFTTDFTEQDVLFSNLMALWPIYAGGRVDAAQEIREAQVREAEQRVDLKVRTTFDDTAKYYFGVVLAQKVIETRKMAEAALDRHLDHAVKLEEQGQIARVERLSAQVTRDRAAVATRKAEDDLEIARLALGSLLGEEEGFHPISPLFVNADLPPAEDFIEHTLETFPGLKILSARAEQADGLIEVESGARLPEVFVFGNVIAYKDNSLASEMMPDWAVGLGLSFDLLDRTGQNDKIEAARSAILQVQHLDRQARRDLRVLVEKTWQEAVQARNEFNGLESSLALAEENIELREKAFAQGFSTSLEVVDAQLFVTAVRTQRMAAAYNYVNALARLLSLSGQREKMAQYQISGVEVTP